MSAIVLQRADGKWYVRDASVSHTDLGTFQSRAAAEHYRDTGVDQPDSPEFDLNVAIEQAISVYTLKTGRAVQTIKVVNENGQAVVTVKTS